MVIVGTRRDGAAYLVPEVESRAKANNVNLLVQPPYDTVAKINEFAEQKKRIAALIHIAC